MNEPDGPQLADKASAGFQTAEAQQIQQKFVKAVEAAANPGTMRASTRAPALHALNAYLKGALLMPQAAIPVIHQLHDIPPGFFEPVMNMIPSSMWGPQLAASALGQFAGL